MPTPYTSVIYSQPQSLESFIIDCSKAFVNTRGFNGKLDLPDRENVEQAKKAHESALENLTELLNYGESDWQAAFEAWCDSMDYFDDENKRILEARRKRLTEMLSKVHAWSAPTPDHIPLQEFMLAQLENELENLERREENERFGFEEWREKELSAAQRLTDDARANFENALLDYNEQYAWVKNLEKSLQKLSQ